MIVFVPDHTLNIVRVPYQEGELDSGTLDSRDVPGFVGRLEVFKV